MKNTKRIKTAAGGAPALRGVAATLKFDANDRLIMDEAAVAAGLVAPPPDPVSSELMVAGASAGVSAPAPPQPMIGIGIPAPPSRPSIPTIPSATPSAGALAGPNAHERALALVDSVRRSALLPANSTCILAPEVKGVYSADLRGSGNISNNSGSSPSSPAGRSAPRGPHERAGVDAEEQARIEAWWRSDIVYDLLTDRSAAAAQRLNTYLRHTRHALTTQGVYPIDAVDADSRKHDIDADVCEEEYQNILVADNLAHKRAHLLIAMYISPPFVALFCPLSGGRRFMTDPEKLNYFLRDGASVFPRLVSQFLVGQLSAKTFVAAALVEWMKLLPSERMDFWRRVNPDDSSVEIKLLTHVPIAPEAARFVHGYITSAVEARAVTAGTDVAIGYLPDSAGAGAGSASGDD